MTTTKTYEVFSAGELSSAIDARDDAVSITVNGPLSIAANTTVPARIALYLGPDGSFDVADGVTLTVEGPITGRQDCFTGAGTVSLDNSPSEYNIGWFAGAYFNDRWDFARRGMTSFRSKVIRFPRPMKGQAGVLESGGRLFWQFSGPILFADAQNSATVHVDAEFIAANDCDAFLRFDDEDKPENIYFYGPLQAIAPAGVTVGVGVDILSGSRISFFGNVVMNGFQTSCALGGTSQTGGVEDIYMPRTQFSFFSVVGLDVYGLGLHAVQNVEIGNLRVTAAQVAGLPATRIRGLVRDLSIDNVYYSTDVAKGGYLALDAEDVVLIESVAAGTIQHVHVGAIYQANANNGVRITSAAADANKVLDVSVGRIFAKFNGSAANLAYCQRVSINGVENLSDVTIASTCGAVSINAGGGLRSLSDSGSQTIVNGLGKQTRGPGLPPSPAVSWPIGTTIRETSDGKLYMRIARNGDASDYLALNP